jgi:deoxyribodipyrimidine photo-lyase
MTASRRLGWNFALERAADMARELGKPLVILEILRVDYPFASPRLHRFMLEGMGERGRALEGGAVRHYPFVEREPGEGNGLLEALARDAALVVSDDFPAFIHPGMAREAGGRIAVRLDLVDSNGILPLRTPDRAFTAAFHFRRYLQRHLPEHLAETPHPSPLARALPDGGGALPGWIVERWPPAPLLRPEGPDLILAGLPLDVSVPGVPSLPGGSAPARRALDRFLAAALSRYAEDRNHPDLEATSGLSPYLHFGNISAQEVFAAVAAVEGWTPLRLAERADGARSGWWGMGEGAEAFLDQLVTWRELGFNMAAREAGYRRYESLPDWARATLEEHEADPRPNLYSMGELREARTGDELWNAAQRQLLQEGVIHNYLRMLWGKKILEWTPTAREALETMVELNDRLALDGRDPNSYSGIFWCLGRYDRGWPERAVYGKVRSMSSSATRRKVQLEEYMRKFGSQGR